MHQWSRLKPDTLLKVLTALAEQGEKRRIAKTPPQPEATAPADPARRAG